MKSTRTSRFPSVSHFFSGPNIHSDLLPAYTNQNDLGNVKESDDSEEKNIRYRKELKALAVDALGKVFDTYKIDVIAAPADCALFVSALLLPVSSSVLSWLAGGN
jgi:hypothetical protein